MYFSQPVCHLTTFQTNHPSDPKNLCSPQNPQALRLSSKTCGFIPSVFSSSPTKQLRFRSTFFTAKSRKKNEDFCGFVWSAFFEKKTCHLLKVEDYDGSPKQEKQSARDFPFLDGFEYENINYISSKNTGLCPQLFPSPPSARWRHFRAAFVANLGLKASLPGTKMLCRTSYSWRF